MITLVTINTVLVLLVLIFSIPFLISLRNNISSEFILKVSELSDFILVPIILATIIIGFILIIYSFLPQKSLSTYINIKKLSIQLLIYKLATIPIFLILLFGGSFFVFIFAAVEFESSANLKDSIILGVVLFSYSYLLLLSSSIPAIKLLRICHKNNACYTSSLLISSFFLLLFATDIISQIYIIMKVETLKNISHFTFETHHTE